jgi:hypothetical protein
MHRTANSPISTCRSTRSATTSRVAIAEPRGRRQVSRDGESFTPTRRLGPKAGIQGRLAVCEWQGA